METTTALAQFAEAPAKERGSRCHGRQLFGL
jgi:hypothetical protein